MSSPAPTEACLPVTASLGAGADRLTRTGVAGVAPCTAPARPALPAASPVLRRLAALSPAFGDRLAGATWEPLRIYGPSAHILGEGEVPASIRALHSGWAGMVRIFPDGRRQIQHLLLPGDIVAVPFGFGAPSGIVALTSVMLQSIDRLVAAAGQAGSDGLRRCAGLVQRHLLNQTARLGRQSACERLANLLLELRDRLGFVGLGDDRRFPMPLTQDALADMLGLTSVHVNRTLQMMRRDGLISLRGGVVDILDVPALSRLADYRAPLPLD